MSMEINDLLNIIFVSTRKIWDVWKVHEGECITAKTVDEVSREIDLSLEEPNRMLMDGLGVEIRASVSSDPASGSLIVHPQIYRSPIK